MDAADLSTIEEILTDYGLDDILEPNLYQDLLSRLQTRENIMIMDAATYRVREGLDRIIEQY